MLSHRSYSLQAVLPTRSVRHQFLMLLTCNLCDAYSRCRSDGSSAVGKRAQATLFGSVAMGTLNLRYETKWGTWNQSRSRFRSDFSFPALQNSHNCAKIMCLAVFITTFLSHSFKSLLSKETFDLNCPSRVYSFPKSEALGFHNVK